MQLINLTPHAVTIGHMEEEKFCLEREIPADGKVARVSSQTVKSDPIDGIAVNAVQLLEVQDLPPQKEGVRYIVSMPVAQFATDRSDLLSPYSEKAFRQGAKILGVPGLVRYEPLPKPVVTEEKTSVLFKEFVNMSFQPITIRTGDQTRSIPKADKVAQLKTEATEGEKVDGIPFYSIKFLDIQNLPSKEEGKIYIVPMPVAQIAGRNDVYAADTEHAIRENGNIVAVPGLVRYI